MAAHRYWRFVMTAGSSAAYAFSEVQFRTTPGVSLPFSGGTASAGQTFGGTPGANDASKAADGSTATLYSSIDKTGTQFWQYDFGATSGNWRDVAQIAITARADSQPAQAPSNFTPQYSDDGTTWTSHLPVTAAAWTTLAQVQTFAVTPLSSGVVLLAHCDGTNGSTTFTDVSPFAHTLTPTSATVSTTSPKFGTGSADFTAGSTARIDTGNAADFYFGSGQFTVEGWVYHTSTPAKDYPLLALWKTGGGSSNQGWFLGMIAAGSLSFYYSTTGIDIPVVQVAYSPPTNAWHHWAADRDASNVLRLYVDGVVMASATVSAAFFFSSLNCIIGNDSTSGANFPGRIDEVRVVNGTAMYGGAFTPPAGPFGGAAATTQARALVLA
jgi:hypothetical protein